MIIHQLFDLEVRPGAGPADEDAATVQRIARDLQALEPEVARYLAAFAFFLSRVASADRRVTGTETAEMQRIVERWGGVPTSHAALVVEIAKAQASLFGGIEDAAIMRQFKSFATPGEHTALLHCLFAVSAADAPISTPEESLVHNIASELGVSDRDFAAIRSSYHDKRTHE
jgi:uncharacterized tellurite resistance protein B-like protein